MAGITALLHLVQILIVKLGGCLGPVHPLLAISLEEKGAGISRKKAAVCVEPLIGPVELFEFKMGKTCNMMALGQAAGTAAALCAAKECGTRDLPYADLRAALEAGGVYFES